MSEHLRVIDGGRASEDARASAPPPHDEAAELSIIATMIFDDSGRLRAEALAILKPQHFHCRKPRTVFEAIAALEAAGEPIDSTTVLSRLRQTGRLGELGPGGLPELFEGVPARGNLAAYARAVRDAWRLRETLREAREVIARIEVCRGSSEDIARGAAYAPTQELLEHAAARLNDLATDSPIITAQSSTEAMRGALALVEGQAERGRGVGLSGVPTGLRALDDFTGGLQPTDLTLLGALSSMGKTGLLVAIAVGAAERGTGVAVFSLEMPTEQLALRAACARSEVSMHSARSGRMTGAQCTALVDAMNELSALPISWDGLTPKNAAARLPNVLELHAKATRAAHAMARKGPPLGLVLVDYLQKIPPLDPRARREETVAKNAAGLKQLAVRLNVPVLCAAALNDESEREHRRPELRDLRESRGAGYDADGVWLLHREDYRRERVGSTAPSAFNGEAEVLVRKARNGPTGTVTLAFDRECMRFRDATPSPAPATSLFPEGPP